MFSHLDVLTQRPRVDRALTRCLEDRFAQRVGLLMVEDTGTTVSDPTPPQTRLLPDPRQAGFVQSRCSRSWSDAGGALTGPAIKNVKLGFQRTLALRARDLFPFPTKSKADLLMMRGG